MGLTSFVRALTGEESLLLIFSKEVGKELNIENQDLLKYEILEDGHQLVITKVLDE